MSTSGTSLVQVSKEAITQQREFTADELQLITDTVAPGLTPNEFKLFIYVARARNLDPLQRQIYAVKRKQWDSDIGGFVERMTIQTGIDGFRAIANRTGLYMPSDKVALIEGTKATDLKVTVWVKKWSPNDRAWHEFSATCYYREFVQTRKKDNQVIPNSMWEKMPISQTEKCAEVKALRRGWPEELGQIYAQEEMSNAGEVVTNAPAAPDAKPTKKERERGTLEASASPNRGHNDTGVSELKKSTERTKTEPGKPQGVSTPTAEAKLSSSVVPGSQAGVEKDSLPKLWSGVVVTVGPKLKQLSIEQMKKNTAAQAEGKPEPCERQPYYELEGSDGLLMSVWDTNLFPAALKCQKKQCTFKISISAKGFTTVEEIVEIAGSKYARDPVDGRAVPLDVLAATEKVIKQPAQGSLLQDPEPQQAAPAEPEKPAAKAEAPAVKAEPPVMASIDGKIREVKTAGADSKPLTTTDGRKYAVIRMAFLVEDQTKDPHDLFLCADEKLIEKLLALVGKEVSFQYEKYQAKGKYRQVIKKLVGKKEELW